MCLYYLIRLLWEKCKDPKHNNCNIMSGYCILCAHIYMIKCILFHISQILHILLKVQHQISLSNAISCHFVPNEINGSRYYMFTTLIFMTFSHYISLPVLDGKWPICINLTDIAFMILSSSESNDIIRES